MWRIGSDTGGTFTDLVSPSGQVVKVLSTPDNPAEAVAAGIAQLQQGEDIADLATADQTPLQELTHGTTVATNALLERKGARVALVCNQGFGDIIEIARQDRPSLYDPFADRPAPLVDRQHRLEVPGRLDASGAEIIALKLDELPRLPPDTEAIAVCLLHSDLNPAHEQAVRDFLADAGAGPDAGTNAASADAGSATATPDITCSHEIAPEFREYERASTTVLNSYLRPRCRSYLKDLSQLAPQVLVMTSAGGLLPAEQAAEAPARLLLSGPAGGVKAAAHYATLNDLPNVVSLDMGGTSTDICLIQNGQPAPAAQRSIDGYPVRVMALDVLTIGAGGGSIAHIDSGGALKVGPQSAGARPGPACYGLGGQLPTVTDANLVCGRLSPEAQLGNLGALQPEAARQAFDRTGIDPRGVLEVVNTNMEQALRAVTTRQGIDPRELALVAFGGAGPLHACELAELLDMGAVIIPPRAGALSAVGILGAPRQVDLVQSWGALLDHPGAQAAADRLRAQAQKQLPEADEITTSFDCRYSGQSHEIQVPSPELFHRQHHQQNGYSRPDTPVEITAVRCVARASLEVPLPDVEREVVAGPAVITEADTTIWVGEGWRSELGRAGSLVLRRV